jgi:O-antigen/teichoic acid export membrane protein
MPALHEHRVRFVLDHSVTERHRKENDSENILSTQVTSTVSVLEDSKPSLEATITESVSATKALESKAIRATFWTVMDYGCSMVLRIVNSLILTRLLMPEHFGLMTLVSTLVVGISLLSDVGLTPNIIQNPRGDDPAFLNTAWTLQVLRGLGIFIITWIFAWPVSWFYHEPRLVWLLPALGFNILVSGFYSTNLLSLSRHMGVRRLFFLDISNQLVSLLVTAFCAWIHPSVWALVIGGMAGSLYRLSISFQRFLIPGIRNSFCWEKESVHSLVHFGKWILLSTALFFFASQADRLILGKLVSFALLGVYGIAYSVSDIPRAVINAFSQKVGYPFIAKMSHLPIAEFRRVFLRYRFYALCVGAAVLCLVTYLGGFVVTKVYDQRYHAASWMVPILALGLWHTLLYATTMPALFSLGKSKYSATGNACYCFAVATAIPVAFRFFGMTGAVVAVAAGDLPLYLVTVSGASREGISTWRQDLQTSAIFLSFLGIGLLVRKVIF